MTSSPTKALLFLPDISGFTRFVNETEIKHSSHIISELLEIIISENNLGLEVAEIEGDAIFFYKLNANTSYDKLMEQSKRMFIAFHAHLKRYEKDRICQCGACTSASQLTLKFVSHLGEVVIQNINNNIKLMGKDVTFVHKLMKNDIKSHEYILMSEALYSEELVSPQQTEQPKILTGETDYDNIGKATYYYNILSPLHSEVPEAPERDKSHYISSNPVTTTITINKPLLDVHSKLIDMGVRPEWRTPIGRVTDDVERLGTIHDCILPNGSHLDVSVLDNIVNDNSIVYKETTNGRGFFGPKSTEVITLKATDENTCELTSEVHLDIPTWRKFLLKRIFTKGIQQSFQKFKTLCEQQ